MKNSNNDPLGYAIRDYAETGVSKDVIVKSEICDDDVIPSAHLLRSFNVMPELEKVAIENSSGKVLEVGAGSGVHASVLKEKGLDVTCIDISEKAVEYMKTQGLNAHQIDFFQYEEKSFETILMIMNGIGIAGELDNLRATLEKAKSLLSKNGKIICDSSDIKYLYQDEDGSIWVDLNSEYYGNFKFQMEYEDQKTDWFNWLYVDFDNLSNIAEEAGFKARILFQEEDHYLAELKLINA